jgi:hypothetical protein
VPLSNVTAWIEADPRVLQQISKVDYKAFPNFTCPNCRNGTYFTSIQDLHNNFAIYLTVYAGPKINTTVYFKDGLNVTLPIKQISIPCFPFCSISFSNAQLTLNSDKSWNAKVEGVAITKVGKINKTARDWGDGGQKDEFLNNKFSFTHHYSSLGPYIIKVTATTNKGVKISKDIQLADFPELKDQPKESDYKISINADTVLNVDTTSPSIDSKSATSFGVSGKLIHLNGIGRNQQELNITLFKADDLGNKRNAPILLTDNNGIYVYKFDPENHDKGNYKVMVIPINASYNHLNVTTNLVVTDSPMTFDQFIQYLSLGIGIAAGVLGAIIKVPTYLSNNRKRNNTSNSIKEINEIYKNYENDTQNKNKYLKELKILPDKFPNLLTRGNIAEDQFKFLDDIITRYVKNIEI